MFAVAAQAWREIRRWIATLIGSVLLLSLASGARADPLPSSLEPLKQRIHSNVLGEDRTIQIFLPAGFKAGSTDRYDVIYVLDGEMLVRFFPPVRSFAEENDLIPPVIIVGVDNLYWYDKGLDSRDRDLLPARVAGSPLSGGADRFLQFLSTELIPYVDKVYPTTGRNSLFGHSYAGMFALYAFLTRPAAFDHYIASDPALWWNDGFVDRLASEKLGGLRGAGKTLFIGGRAGGIHQAFGIARMESLLRAKAPSSLRWQSVANRDEDHGSVRLKNIYDGLKFTYFGHSGSMIDVFPNDGILLKGKPIAIMNYSSFDEEPGIRYTADGSEPTTRSPKYDYGIRISAPARLTVKQFSNWGPDKKVTGKFVLGRPLQPAALPAGATAGGLHYDEYAGASGDPTGHAGPPAAAGRANVDFNLGRFGRAPFAMTLSGYFQAKADGYYIFFIESDAAATLAVGGRQLIAIDPARDGREQKSFVVPLKRGFYPLRLAYRHQAGDARLNLTYLSPVRPDDTLAHLPIMIPNALLYASDLP